MKIWTPVVNLYGIYDIESNFFFFAFNHFQKQTKKDFIKIFPVIRIDYVFMLTAYPTNKQTNKDCN